MNCLAVTPAMQEALNPDDFTNPPLAARPGAFWPWLNGHVSLERITYELEQMKEKGMSGADIWDVRAQINPDGMVPVGPPFLGDESLNAIAHAVKEAKRLGLKLGMIAASGWNAGGTWIEPADASMGLYSSETTLKGPGRINQQLAFPEVPALCPKDASGRPLYYREVAVLAIPRREPAEAAPVKQILDLREHLDADGQLTWDAPAGEWSVRRFIMTNTGQRLIVPSPRSDGPMIDFLNPESSRKHFQHIVDRLESKLGKLHDWPLTYLEVDSLELGEGIPWTANILQVFEQQHGYDPLPYVPTLAGAVVESRDISDRFLYDWRKTVSELFIDAHYRTGRELLNRNGLQLCAEAGGPGAPIWPTCPVDALKALGAVDIMRGEFWPKHRNMWLVKEIASAAHIYGRRIVDAESFTSWRHWQDGPYYLKQLADNAMCEGLNHFTFHTFTHSPSEAGLPGNAYHAGTHINPNVVWWPMARAFVDYLARCSALLQQGHFVADVCYYYGDEAPNFVPAKHVGFSPGAGYDYDVVNSDVILNRMSVRDGRIVLPDGMNYAVLVLPERQDMDLAVLQKLETLIESGATIIGPRPTRTATLEDYPQRDRLVAELAEKVWGDCDGDSIKERTLGRGRVIWNRAVADVLADKGFGPDFCFRGPDGRTRLDYLHRRTADADIYFVNNRNERWEAVECTFRVKGKQPELWDPQTGQSRLLPAFEATAEGTRVMLHLAPAESVFIVFRNPAPAGHFTRIESPAGALPELAPALLPHSATPGGPMWLSDAVGPVEKQFITFDLGQPRTLEKIRIWNYNENVRGLINYGVKDVDLLVSSDAVLFEKAGSFSLRDAGENEDRDYHQDLTVTTRATRYVRFEVKSNHNRPGYMDGISRRAGLSKVAFYAPQEVSGVDIHEVSSGAAFSPATDARLGTLHPRAELLAGRDGVTRLRAWQPGEYVLNDADGRSQTMAVGPLPEPLDIRSAWEVGFTSGRAAPANETFPKLISWTEHADPGIQFFSGIAAYKNAFDLPDEYREQNVRLELDLGIVQHVARVMLNGRELGVLWKPPYCVDVTDAVRPGRNEIIVEVANTWKNRLAGDAGLSVADRITRTNVANPAASKRAPQRGSLEPAGLLGPVQVRAARDLVVRE